MLLSLENYTKCQDLTRPPNANGANCRHGYGIPIVKHYGPSCAYCGKDLSESYDAWLDLSVDHVVPRQAIGNKKWGATETYMNWIESLANLVPCCTACNEFLNGYKTGITDQPPADGRAFLALRDEMLAGKREYALRRHQLEREYYADWPPTLYPRTEVEVTDVRKAA